MSGRTYPGHAIVVQRSLFDRALQRAAIEAGAQFLHRQCGRTHRRERATWWFLVVVGERIRADMIVGADGAASRVANVVGLVDPRRVLWGFAVRSYRDESVTLPHIVLWTPKPGHAFPGYGWVFPAGDRGVNVGLGVGTLADRTAGRRAARDLDAFLDHAARVGVLDGPVSRTTTRPLGAWLKMGLVGTVPARDRVLLVGDAAGLVNPLQGEGIAQAMDSGRAAAVAILAGAEHAAHRYKAHLTHTHAAYLATAASVHRTLLRRPSAVGAVTRALTAPGVGRALAGGWSIVWNDLLDGAPRGRAATTAATASGLGRLLTARSADRRWIDTYVRTSR